jgi:hypothetical protein
MVRKQIVMDRSLEEALVRRAQEAGLSQSQLISRALESYLEQADADARRMEAWLEFETIARDGEHGAQLPWTREGLHERGHRPD